MKKLGQALSIVTLTLYCSLSGGNKTLPKQLPLEKKIVAAHLDEVNALACHPYQYYFASGSDDQSIKIWDTSNPLQPICVKVLTEQHSRISSLAFSPNGSLLAAGTYDGKIILWNTQKINVPIKIIAFQASKNALHGLCFPSKPGYLAAITNDDLLICKIQDIKNPLWKIMRHVKQRESSKTLSLAFSHNSRYLATGSADGTVTLWATEDLWNFSRLTQRQYHSGAVRTLCFSHHGELLASGGDDRKIYLWKMSELMSFQPPISLPEHAGSVRSLTFSLNNHYLISGSQDNTVKLWHLESFSHKKAPELQTLYPSIGTIKTVGCSSDGASIICGGSSGEIALFTQTH